MLVSAFFSHYTNLTVRRAIIKTGDRYGSMSPFSTSLDCCPVIDRMACTNLAITSKLGELQSMQLSLANTARSLLLSL